MLPPLAAHLSTLCDHPLRILVLSHLYPRANDGVLGVFIQRQTEELQRLGCDITVVSPVPWVPTLLQTTPRRRGYRDVPFKTVYKGISVYYPRYMCLPGSIFHGIGAYSLRMGIRKLLSTLASFGRFDILLAHSCTPDGFACLDGAFLPSTPIVCSFRGDDINIYPQYKPFAYRQTVRVIKEADGLIAVSNALKMASEKLAPPGNPIEVIHNGCDANMFGFDPSLRDDCRRSLGIPADEPVLLFVGSLELEKGIFELLDAFLRLIPRFPALHLIMVGDGPEMPKLKSLMDDGNPAWRRLHLTGRISHDRTVAYYCASDIFVFPSHNEGFPNVIKEAMACGRPVVASAVGGIPEVVHDSETGLLVPSHDANALYESIVRLLNDDNCRTSMSARAAALIASRYSWNANASAHLDYFRLVIKMYRHESGAQGR